MNRFLIFVVQYAHIIYTLTTMKYEIEKDVPMPERNVRGKPIKYDLPLVEMDKGDHIFIKISKSKIDKEIKIIRNAVHRFKSVRLDMSFSVIKMKGGVGIERTN